MKRKSAIYLLILLGLGVNLFSQNSHLEMLENAKHIEQEYCSSNSNLTFSPCPFNKGDTVFYNFINKPPVHDSEGLVEEIDQEIINFMKWHLNKVAYRDSTRSDIDISFLYIDGIGGTLARAMYPYCDSTVQSLEYDNYDLPPGKSTPDSIKILYGDNLKDIPTITKHELGHIVGLRHSIADNDLMYPIYKEGADWSMAEKIILQMMFSRNMIYIQKEDDTKVLNNFRLNEFFTKCPGYNYHFLSGSVMISAQLIREYYRDPIYITSSYRGPVCNKNAGGSSKSTHMSGRAIDFKFENKANLDLFAEDILNRGYLFNKLYERGVRGIGLYSSHIHIDCRQRDSIVIWDHRNLVIEDEEYCEH